MLKSEKAKKKGRKGDKKRGAWPPVIENNVM